MAVSGDKTFWGFIFYVKNNPFKSIAAMNEDDFDAMVKAYAAVNTGQVTMTVATAKDYPDYYGYGAVDVSTDLHFPAKGTSGARWAADNAGVDTSTTYALNIAAVKTASYPEEHLGE